VTLSVAPINAMIFIC